MGCDFCSCTRFLEDAVGQKQHVLMLPPEDILSLVQSALEAHLDIKTIYFKDDNFLLDKKRVEDFCALAAKNIAARRVKFFCYSRVDTVDAQILSCMKTAGFEAIVFGVSCFSDKTIADMDGGTVSCNNLVWETFEHKIVSLRREKAEGYVYGLEAKYKKNTVGKLQFILSPYALGEAEITELFWKDAGIVGCGFGKKAWELLLNKIISCDRYDGVYRLDGKIPPCAFSDNLKLFVCLGFDMVNLSESKSGEGLLIKRTVRLERKIEGGN